MNSHPPKLNEAFVKALGLLAVNYSYLEHRLVLFLCALISPNEKIGLTLVSEMHIGQITNALMSLYRQRIQEEASVNDLKILLTDIIKLKEKRDSIAHSHWYVTSTVNPGEILRFKTTAKFKKGLHVAIEDHEDEINEISTDMVNCAQRLDGFWERSGVPKAK